MLSKITSFIFIIRPINFIITFLSIFVATLICLENKAFTPEIFLAALAGGFVAGAGNIINDIFDVEIDRINRPGRVLPSGKLNKNEALFFYFSLNALAIIITSFLNGIAFAILISSVIIVFLYSYRLKSIPLVGNFIVAFMTGLAFVFGGTAVGNLKHAVIPALFAFIINFIREIVKDMEDMEGDKKNNIFTFPGKYGFIASIRIILVLTILLILFTFIPFIYDLYKIEYFIIVMLSVNILMIYFIKYIFTNQSKFVLHRSSLLLKANMIFGLIAIYFGK